MAKHTDRSPVHISIVLDRSGSMSSIAGDIVGGFNEFLRRQRQERGEARVTLVQFDGEDPFELLIDAKPLDVVRNLDHKRYQPRGMTPLFDAVGRMIGRIDGEVARRQHADEAREDQVVVIVTDGLENASREHTRESIFRMVENRKKEQDWVFVFMGANQDSYAEGARMAVAHGNAANWEFSSKGARRAFQDLADATVAHRAKSAPARAASKEAYFRKPRG